MTSLTFFILYHYQIYAPPAHLFTVQLLALRTGIFAKHCNIAPNVSILIRTMIIAAPPSRLLSKTRLKLPSTTVPWGKCESD